MYVGMCMQDKLSRFGKTRVMFVFGCAGKERWSWLDWENGKRDVQCVPT